MKHLFEFVEKTIGAITEENGWEILADDFVEYYDFESAALFAHLLKRHYRPYLFKSSYWLGAAPINETRMIPGSISYAQEICPERIELFLVALPARLPVREIEIAEISPVENHEPKGHS